jgi:hexokinase
MINYHPVLGGSNFRVLKITLDAKNKEISQVDSQVKISDEVKKSDQETLFNFISDSLAGFIRDQKIDNVLPLGFTFSFPVRQTNLTAGTLIHWTKDFTAKDCEGHDVIVMLNDASKRQKNPPTDVVALVNDTTGTQMAVGYGDKECHVGVILGTGTNACYTEKLDKVEKFTGNKSDYDKVIINTEWGAFGDKGSLDGTHIVNKYDEALDSQEEVTNKKTQMYVVQLTNMIHICKLYQSDYRFVLVMRS